MSAGGAAAGGHSGGAGGSSGAAPTACKPPSPEGQECSDHCGWTLETRPAGYGNSQDCSALACGLGVDGSAVPDHSVVLTNTYPSCDVLHPETHTCPTTQWAFYVPPHKCSRFTAMPGSTAAFFNSTSKPSSSCDGNAQCIVVTHPDECANNPNCTMVQVVNVTQDAWVRAETADSPGDVCPLTCP